MTRVLPPLGVHCTLHCKLCICTCWCSVYIMYCTVAHVLNTVQPLVAATTDITTEIISWGNTSIICNYLNTSRTSATTAVVTGIISWKFKFFGSIPHLDCTVLQATGQCQNKPLAPMLRCSLQYCNRTALQTSLVECTALHCTLFYCITSLPWPWTAQQPAQCTFLKICAAVFGACYNTLSLLQWGSELWGSFNRK